MRVYDDVALFWGDLRSEPDVCIQKSLLSMPKCTGPGTNIIYCEIHPPVQEYKLDLSANTQSQETSSILISSHYLTHKTDKSSLYLHEEIMTLWN